MKPVGVRIPIDLLKIIKIKEPNKSIGEVVRCALCKIYINNTESLDIDTDFLLEKIDELL